MKAILLVTLLASNQLIAGSSDYIEKTHKMPNEVISIPQLYSTSFNSLDVPDQYSYRDSGIRYEFRINSNYQVEYRRGVADSKWELLTPEKGKVYCGDIDGPIAISYNERRGAGKKCKREGDFDLFPAPQFDMVASDGGRVFAKERGSDRLFFTSMSVEEIGFSTDPSRFTPVDILTSR